MPSIGLGAMFYLRPFPESKSIDEDFPLPAGFFRQIVEFPPGTMDWRQANPARAGRQQRQLDRLCRSSLADFFMGGGFGRWWGVEEGERGSSLTTDLRRFWVDLLGDARALSWNRRLLLGFQVEHARFRGGCHSGECGARDVGLGGIFRASVAGIGRAR